MAIRSIVGEATEYDKKMRLEANNIKKTYKRKEVLKDISLSIKTGEIIALVGTNGCGKSTLLRILAGITMPSAGKVVTSPDCRFSFIPDRYEKSSFTIPGFMEHMQRILHINAKEQLETYYKNFHLEDMLDTPMKQLSKGTLQKAAIIQALIGEKDMLFMDEPLSGQDIKSQQYFVKEIKSQKEQGLSVVMACHEPFLVKELADKVYQIKDGILIDGREYG
ncbi:MAG: ATP-binding cassette domain-containing protein [Roseburia sp.]|nr:ATP-binding cassette domain-containing protein [Roseburia sp.]MCM1279828.1 ATP-binding cassette domain-containing protein [Robinsoniella sp.]